MTIEIARRQKAQQKQTKLLEDCLKNFEDLYIGWFLLGSSTVSLILLELTLSFRGIGEQERLGYQACSLFTY